MSKPSTSFLLLLSPKRVHPIIPALLLFLVVNAIATAVFLLEGIDIKLPEDGGIVPYVYQGPLVFGGAYAYLLFVIRLINNVHVKDFNKLLEFSDLDDQRKQEWNWKMLNHRSQWVETVIAVLVGIFHSYLQGPGKVFLGESTLVIYDLWRVLLNVTIWVMITHSTSLFIRNMTLLNDLSREVEIDLLNMEKFMPLTRSGVWSILGFIGVYSIIFSQGVNHINLADPAILVLAPSIFFMIRTPLKGFRKRVIDAKETELGIIEAAIEGDREALKKSRIKANLDNINVIDLINYKKMIQNTFEIPVNIPTASRFVFYLIIPILTWVASSMVDKLIVFLIK